MTTFLDGPAEGKTLMLKRAPHYLRVVRNAAGEIDALDQLEDTPREDEAVFAYEMVSGPRSMHVCSRGRGARSGFYQGGDYRLVDEQPEAEALQSTSKWRAWVMVKIGKPVAADGTIAEASR